MDPNPLRLLETAHPLRSRSISQGTPKPRFRIRPNYRLKRPLKLVHKTVNNFIKFVDGPTQMSRPRLFPGGTSETPAACFLVFFFFYPRAPLRSSITNRRRGRGRRRGRF